MLISVEALPSQVCSARGSDVWHSKRTTLLANALRRTFVDAPYLVETSARTLVVGVPTLPAHGQLRSNGLPSSPSGISVKANGNIALLPALPTVPGTPLPSPRFGNDSGDVGALWAVTTRPQQQQVITRAFSVFYSRLGRAGVWSSPESLVTTTRGTWLGDAMSDLVSRDGRLALAFAMSDSTGPGIRILLRRDSGWTHTQLSTYSRPTYLRLVALNTSDLVLIQVGGGGGESGVPNLVWVRRSRNWGATWGTPKLVSAEQLQGAHHPRLFVHNGALSVVWSEAGALNNAEYRSLVHAQSRDGGVSWSAPRRWAAPSAFDQFDVVSVGSGTLVAVFRVTDRTTTANLILSSFAPNGQEGKSSRLSGVALTAPHLLRTHDNAVLLWFAEGEQDGDGYRPRTHVLGLEIDCKGSKQSEK